MAQKYLVRTMIGEGGRLLVHLAAHDFPIEAASWVYKEELDDWQLHIATPVVDTEGPLEAYVRMQELLNHQSPRFAMESDSIALRGPDDPLLKSLATAAIRRGRKGITEVRDSRVEGHFVDGAFIYWPLPKTLHDLEAILV